ncbi:MAG: hypothetical protein KAU17_12075 [Spirochaetales bacterium]|nr:hypothetical protein [Spirochaetales bacterium]
MKDDDIEIALLNSVAKDNLKGIIENSAEYALDSILETDELKQIPVFGTLIKLASAASSIRDRLFAKKIYKFLAAIKDIPAEKRQEFIRNIESKRCGRRRLGETILLLLEKLDDMEKPELIGKVFHKCIIGEIPYKTALRLCAIIDRVYFPDLDDLVKSYRGKKIGYDVSASLAGIGLMEVSEIDGGHFTDEIQDSWEEGGAKYRVNWHGRLFVEKILLENTNFA